MKQMSIMIDLNRCIGCKTCIVACRNGKDMVDHKVALPNQIPSYLRVETKENGVYPELSLHTWVVPCQHCQKPGCLSSCQHGAITKDQQSGVVRIDPEKCTGCEFKAEAGSANKSLPSPCVLSCPAGTNVQGYVQLVKQGKYEEAIKLIMRRVPLPGVLGRVCPHPCEDVCRRVEVDQAVSIRELKRAAADAVDFSTLEIPKIKDTGIKIAVIGSGPAGLTAAYDLRLKGHSVTIFEAMEVLGGMLRTGIPEFRLPRAVLDREINYLLRHGIETRTGVRFGEDVTLAELAEDGFAAVMLGIGMQSGAKMNVPGEDSEGVLDALAFLRQVNLGKRQALHADRVVVVGGGNTAIDAARTAKLLGCKEVTVVYRRTANEMPAYQEEVASARMEGVTFMELAMPVEILTRAGKIEGLRCFPCKLGEPDSSGRPRPVPVEDSAFIVDCDAVIPAVGQRMDAAWISRMPELATTTAATFAVTEYLQTNIMQVFAAGDVVRGPASVIEAIADGHRVAEAIDRFAQGLPAAPELALPESRIDNYEWEPVPAGIFKSTPRHMAAYLAPQQRSTSFAEECNGLAKDEVAAEAERCLNCGCACMNSCDFGVIQFDGKSGISHKCDLCEERITSGQPPVCVEVCLTDALTFGEHELLKQSALDKGREIIAELSKASHIYIR